MVNFWYHYCEVDKTILGVETGYPCNWCDVQEFACDEVSDEHGKQ